MRKLLFLALLIFWSLPTLTNAYSSYSSTDYTISQIQRETERMQSCLRSSNAHWDFWYSMCTCDSWYTRFYDDLEDTYNIGISCLPKEDQKIITAIAVNEKKHIFWFTTFEGTYMANISTQTWAFREGCNTIFMKPDKIYYLVKYLNKTFITYPTYWYCEITDIDEVSQYIPRLTIQAKQEIIKATRWIRNKADRKRKLQELWDTYENKIKELNFQATEVFKLVAKQSIVNSAIEKIK